MNRGAQILASKLEPRGAQAALARDMNVGPDVVCRFCKGEKIPAPRQRAFLEDRFGINWRLWDETVDDEVPNKGAA